MEPRSASRISSEPECLVYFGACQRRSNGLLGHLPTSFDARQALRISGPRVPPEMGGRAACNSARRGGGAESAQF